VIQFPPPALRVLNQPSSAQALLMLRVIKTLRPDRNGAKRFTRRFGEQLVCVRHRLDPSGHIRYTTVELITECTPIASRAEALIALRIPGHDRATRQLLLASGAHWMPRPRHWLLPHGVAKRLGLLHRRVSKGK
jgi:hypothetical protein